MTSTKKQFGLEKKDNPENETHLTETLSSAKRKPYIPRRLMNLTPLNLNSLRKEIEAEEKEIQTYYTNLMNNVDEKDDVSDDSALSKEKINLSPITEESTQTVIPKNSNNLLKSNKKTKNEPIEETKTYKKENDSRFDFEFSILSLITPVKKDIDNDNNNKRDLKLVPSKKFDKLTLVTPINKTCFPNNPCQTRLKFEPKKPKTENKQTQCCSFPFPNSNANAFKNASFKTIEINGNEYVMLNLLGKGGSSKVYHCFNLKNNLHVAVKCVCLENPQSSTGYKNEVKLLRKLQNCDKIIKMYDYSIVESQKKLYVVLEKGGEDLSTILKQLASQKEHVPVYMLIFYWMEMLNAVKQIHSQGVIHSDLKPANFIKSEGGLKLIDFGIASSVQTDADVTSVMKSSQEGSINYISPEALVSHSHSSPSSPNFGGGEFRYKIHYKSDVWSLGCILYQLVYRRTPFQHIAQLWMKLGTITNPKHVIDYPKADWVSGRIVKTVKECLRYDVKERPSVDELIREYEDVLCNS